MAAAICAKVRARLETPTAIPANWAGGKDLDFKADMTCMADGVVDNSMASKAASVRWISLSAANAGNGCVGNTCVYSFKKTSIWGTTGNPKVDDVGQGELGDCYFLATISILAEHSGRVQKLF